MKQAVKGTMSDEKFTKDEIKAYSERKNLSYSNMFYSVQRIDLLVIAISGGGIYVCFETLKYLSENHRCVSLWLKWSLFILLFSIILNFLSQMFGKKSNEHDYLMCLEAENQNRAEHDTHDRKSESYSKAVDFSNIASVITMFVGLSLLAIYFSVIF